MALFFAMPVGAQSSEGRSNDNGTVQLVEPNLVKGLIAWIAAKTGWLVQEPPPVRFVTPTQLLKMYDEAGSSKNIQIRALYSTTTHTVYLLENWKPNDLHDRSELLHELVHHLQAINNVKAECLAANEPQAFNLQFEWLREQGIQNPYKFLDTNELTILLISRCREFGF
jgi:hypothetical protein